MTHLVFVYGTLKRGERNAHYLDDDRFIQATTTSEGVWRLYELRSTDDPEQACPGASPDGGGDVAGEVFEVSDNTLFKIDQLEDEGARYIREMRPLSSGHKAWIYVHVNKDEPVIAPQFILFDPVTRIYLWEGR